MNIIFDLVMSLDEIYNINDTIILNEANVSLKVADWPELNTKGDWMGAQPAFYRLKKDNKSIERKAIFTSIWCILHPINETNDDVRYISSSSKSRSKQLIE